MSMTVGLLMAGRLRMGAFPGSLKIHAVEHTLTDWTKAAAPDANSPLRRCTSPGAWTIAPWSGGTLILRQEHNRRVGHRRRRDKTWRSLTWSTQTARRRVLRDRMKMTVTVSVILGGYIVVERSPS